MQTPIQAMLWELSRLSRIELPLRMGAMCFFAIVLYFVGRDLGEFQIRAIQGIAVMMFMVSAPFSSAWLGELDSHSKGFSFRLGFVRPVSTVLLVLVPLVFTVVTSVACYLIPALVSSYLWNTSLPMLGPSLLIALVVQLSIAVVWSLTSHASKIVGIILLAAVVMGLVVFLVARSDSPEPILFAIARPSYFALSWLQTSCLFAAMLATTIATIMAVDRQRHGDDWVPSLRFMFPEGLRGPANSETHSRAIPWSPFRSVVTAQCWYEWRQFGSKVLIAGLLAPLFVITFLVVCNLLNPGRNPNTVTWIIALALSPVFFQMIAVDGAIGLKHVHGTTRLSLFDATRSLSSDQIIFIKLLVVAGSSLAAWLCMASVAWFDLVLLGHGDDWDRNHLVSTALANTLPKISSQMGSIGWFAGFCNVLLLFVSSSSSLVAFGLWVSVYRVRMVLLVVITALHATALVFAFKYGWQIQFVLTAYGYLLAGLVLFVCVASIRRSLKLGAMRQSYFIAFGVLWAVYVLSVMVLFGKVTDHIPIAIPNAAIVLGASLLIVPLAATAVAPLAYATHRNG
jgi:hypothetical protein